MNNSQNNLLQKMIELEERIQEAEGIINITQKQLLEVSRELSNSILFEKAKSEVCSK